MKRDVPSKAVFPKQQVRIREALNSNGMPFRNKCILRDVEANSEYYVKGSYKKLHDEVTNFNSPRTQIGFNYKNRK